MSHVIALSVDASDTLIAAVVALIFAVAGYIKSVTAGKTADGADKSAKESSIKSASADAKSDIANDRIGNVSRAQDTLRSDLTTVAANQVPASSVQPRSAPPANPAGSENLSVTGTVSLNPVNPQDGNT